MTQTHAANSPSDPLQADTILGAEFAYIADTAAQAGDDRSTVTNFLLTTIGSLAAFLLGFQTDIADATLYKAMSLLLAALSIFGFLTLLQLVRLRTAWHESIVAMNQIKDFYIDNLRHHIPDLAEAFAWRRTTCPKNFKPLSFSWLLAAQVGFLGALTCAGAIFFALMGFTDIGLADRAETAFIISVVAGILYGLGASLYYRQRLRNADQQESERRNVYETERRLRNAAADAQSRTPRFKSSEPRQIIWISLLTGAIAGFLAGRFRRGGRRSG